MESRADQFGTGGAATILLICPSLTMEVSAKIQERVEIQFGAGPFSAERKLETSAACDLKSEKTTEGNPMVKGTLLPADGRVKPNFPRS